MKRTLLLLVLTGCCQPLFSQALPLRELHGRIVNMSTTPATSVPSARVKILTIDKETTTNRDGEFFLRLPDTLKAGEPIEITVDAQQAGTLLRLFQPLDGRIDIPSDATLSRRVVQIGVLPKGSLRFYSDEALDALFRLANRTVQKETKNTSEAASSAGSVKLEDFLKQWGQEQGIDPTELTSRVNAWIRKIERQPSADGEKQALVAVARSDFEKAGRLFGEAGDERLRKLKELRKQEEDDRRQVVEDYTQSGDADFNGGLYRRALEDYSKALAENDRERYPFSWAILRQTMGDTYTQLGETQIGPDVISAFDSAIACYNDALQVFTQKEHPPDWAKVQDRLATTLRVQAQHSEVEKARILLAKAVDAYRNALHIRTREQMPQQWAMTQHNLGLVLEVQAENGRAPSRMLLAQAVECYLNALQVFIREENPQEWAEIQNSLGNAFEDQALQSSGKERAMLLVKAVEAYRLALQVRTRERLPQKWAMTQNNLGVAFLSQSENSREEGRMLAAQAIEAYHNALEVFTKGSLPQGWAKIQVNLGNALRAQGEKSDGEQARTLLAQAVEAQRNALQVYTREQLPARWAATQSNLGAALGTQAQKSPGEQALTLLTQAVEAEQNALQIYTFETEPLKWAEVQYNLGIFLTAQGEKSPSEQARTLLAQAVEAEQNALQIYTREKKPEDTAKTLGNLGTTLSDLGQRSTPELAQPLFMQAAEALSSALRVLPNDTELMQRMGFILHEHLFDFQKAYVINKQRADQLPEDKGAAADLIESEFTIGRFSECATRSARLRRSLGPQDEFQAVLHVLEASCQLGQAHITDALALITELSDYLANTTNPSPLSFAFSGTRHFVDTSRALASYREPLLGLLFALESSKAASVKQALEALVKVLTISRTQ
jgi:tetratricopeptide (TPR) repeat protein